MKEEGREEEREEGWMGICQVLRRERALEAEIERKGPGSIRADFGRHETR